MTFTRYELTIPVELTSGSTSAMSTLSPTATEREPHPFLSPNGLKEPTIQAVPSGVRFAACNVLWEERKLKDDPSGAFSETNGNRCGVTIADHEGLPEDVLPFVEAR